MIFESFLSLINSVLPFLVILTILVFVHELGHYLVALFNGVKVDVFSIGFGKEIIGFNDKSGTRWKFSLIPLGGYVKMHGDEDASSSKKSKNTKINKDISFHHKTVFQRSAILFAGPAANFLFSLILLIFINCYYGLTVTKPIISELIPEKPAIEAGLMEGDLVLKVNNNQVKSFQEIQKYLVGVDGQRIIFTISRNDKILDYSVLVQNQKIGIKGKDIYLEKLNFFESITKSSDQILFFTKATLIGIAEIFTGSRSSDELGGPIRIAELSSDFWQKGIHSTLWFMVLISLNLGLINLFPIPLLDGGHLLFNFIEIIKGSPLNQKSLEIFHNIGFVMLISLMLFATYNDISRFIE